MKLYHGTSAHFLDAIKQEGIKPRGKTKGNWDRAPSNEGAVYLTDAYAPYFSVATDEKYGAGGIVVEIDTDRMARRFVPDEDVLEQAGRSFDDVKGDMLKRTAYYRSQLKNFVGLDNWKKSLEFMGTCAYLGTVPVTAISRIAVIPKKNMVDVAFAWDASISRMNYMVLGEEYRIKTIRLFKDTTKLTQSEVAFKGLHDEWKPADLSFANVIDMRSKP